MALARLKSVEKRISFLARDWTNDSIVVIPSGIPTQGQIGPHNLPIPRFYETSVYKAESNITKETGVTIRHNMNTGTITIIKASKMVSYDGVIFIKAYE